MKCPHCQSEFTDLSFCIHCGTAKPKTWPNLKPQFNFRFWIKAALVSSFVIGLLILAFKPVTVIVPYDSNTMLAAGGECDALNLQTIEKVRDYNGIIHQTRCYDPATGQITLPLVGSITTNGSITIGGGSPWFDVTSPAYGLNTCTGSTHDDTSAFLLAATTANNAGGGTILVPKNCFLNTTLNLNSFVNVRLTGIGGPQWMIGSPGSFPVISCGMSGSGDCISAEGIRGFELDHLNITYTNAGFTGDRKSVV